jgi:hypothetical protein
MPAAMLLKALRMFKKGIVEGRIITARPLGTSMIPL